MQHHHSSGILALMVSYYVLLHNGKECHIMLMSQLAISPQLLHGRNLLHVRRSYQSTEEHTPRNCDYFADCDNSILYVICGPSRHGTL